MPYIYQMAVNSHHTGIPTMRSMVMEFEDDPATKYLDMQYMLGDNILVAPVFSADGDVEYYLPEGTWTHLLSREVKQGGRWYKENYDFMSLPVYVRDNTLLALGNNEKTADYEFTNGVEIRVYEVKDGCKTSCLVPDQKGQTALTVEAFRENSKLTLTSTGQNQNMRYVLENVANVSNVTGAAKVEETAAGIVIIPKADKVVVEFGI